MVSLSTPPSDARRHLDPILDCSFRDRPHNFDACHPAYDRHPNDGGTPPCDADDQRDRGRVDVECSSRGGRHPNGDRVFSGISHFDRFKVRKIQAWLRDEVLEAGCVA